MISVFFELELLRTSLLNKGLDEETVSRIVDNAKEEIDRTIAEDAKEAMDQAIEEGVEKRSPEFINDLMFNNVTLTLNTISGDTDFSDPPFPMLPYLLKNAKPMKDGSGVYKVIPVGEPATTPRPSISANIYDEFKKQSAQRAEQADNLRRKNAPRGSKANFRTASSKQSMNDAWVMPRQEKDFRGVLEDINSQLAPNLEQKIRDIIRSVEEGY